MFVVSIDAFDENLALEVVELLVKEPNFSVNSEYDLDETKQFNIIPMFYKKYLNVFPSSTKGFDEIDRIRWNFPLRDDFIDFSIFISSDSDGTEYSEFIYYNYDPDRTIVIHHDERFKTKVISDTIICDLEDFIERF